MDVALSANRSGSTPMVLVLNGGSWVYGNRAYASSSVLAAQLQSKNVPHKLYSLQGAGHDLGFTNPKTSSFILKEVVSWITVYSK